MVLRVGGRAAAAGALGLILALPLSAAAAWQPVADTALSTYGTVRRIEQLAPDRLLGAGAVMGGILGAVIAREMADSSRGRNVASAIGAAAGALIGREIEKSLRRDQPAVRITVTLDNGQVSEFEFRDGAGDLRVGDRVRVDGNMLYRVS